MRTVEQEIIHKQLESMRGPVAPDRESRNAQHNPKAGKPAMNAAPKTTLALPLKALACEDISGAIPVSYNSPEHLLQRHLIPADAGKVLCAIRQWLQSTVD